MVYIVTFADAVRKPHQVADRCDHIGRNDMMRYELKEIFFERFTEFFIRHLILGLKKLHQRRIVDMLVDAHFLGVKVEIACRIDKVIADYADAPFGGDDINAQYAGVFDGLCSILGDDLAL